MESKKRIYLVSTPAGLRLIDAANKSQAINHVASTTITATVATQTDLVGLIQDGIKVETAGGEK